MTKNGFEKTTTKDAYMMMFFMDDSHNHHVHTHTKGKQTGDKPNQKNMMMH